jgi:hypothetical protein
MSSSSAPSHQVGDCNDLGAIDEFQNITPPGVSKVLNVLIDPVNSGTIYAGTYAEGLYKSVNCGSTWVKINTGNGADLIDSGFQWSMEIDPIYPNILYAGSLYGKDNSLLKSDDGGIDWYPVFPATSEVAQVVEYNWTQEASMDPNDRLHLAVSFHANCFGQYAPMCLAESFDGGVTWKLFKGPANNWVENARPIIIDKDQLLYVTALDGTFYTKDHGASWPRVSPGGYHQMYRSITGVYYLGQQYGMQTSTDGHTWTMIDKSPGGDGLIGDGQRIFTVFDNMTDKNQLYMTTDETDGQNWKKLPSPAGLTRGSGWLRYDKDHSLLYSPNIEGGLWRFRTK